MGQNAVNSYYVTRISDLGESYREEGGGDARVAASGKWRSANSLTLSKYNI